jgi:DNA helicase-2/ATP-dependent DNA helicase PcrA
VAREYDAMAEQGSVGEFLQQIALIADVDSLRDDEGLVTLMTLHNAKGLEFPIVFMIGMEDGVFPHSRAIEEGAIEEERRLAYVGLTRAMRDLTLTYARRRNMFGGGGAPALRSRFIDEVPRELTDQEDRAAVGAGWAPGRVASWSNAAAATAEARPETAGTVFRLGDDVVHAAFGEGVVTGTEPGGIVVVRFAGDGSERKLMADYAPLKKQG